METSSHTGKTARYLAQYWKNAYQIRARGLTIHPTITSSKVMELVAYSYWQERAWSIDFVANHAMALHQVITRNTDEIRAILEQAKDDGLTQEEVTDLYERAQLLRREAGAANDLLGILNNG